LSTQEQQENNNNANIETQLDQAAQAGQEIREVQEKELTYIMEVGQINDKRTKYLAKKNEYKIMFDDGTEQTFTRKPLSSKKNKEIDELRSGFTSRFNASGGLNNKIKIGSRTFDDSMAVLHEAYKKTAEYCLGLKEEQYDSAIWEDFPEYMDKDIYGLQSILVACWIRSIHGVAYFPHASKNG
jgi:hypothetical protein